MVCVSFPREIWFELQPESDCCDAFVQLEDGCLYSAIFVTPAHIQRQMKLTAQLSRSQSGALLAPYAVLDTTHIVVESLARAVMVDTIDNLIAQDVFESCFTRISAEPTSNDDDSRFATQEMAAVVMHDVLRVEGG